MSDHRIDEARKIGEIRAQNERELRWYNSTSRLIASVTVLQEAALAIEELRVENIRMRREIERLRAEIKDGRDPYLKEDGR
jgi:hypothetical protein